MLSLWLLLARLSCIYLLIHFAIGTSRCVADCGMRVRGLLSSAAVSAQLKGTWSS